MSDSTGHRLVAGLEALGVRVLFGLPGTQNVGLFEALRTSSIRSIVATNETAASFMALGYGRASGEPGVLATIPGPGFTYALSGLAEARLDSVPLIHIVVQDPPHPGRVFRHQEIDHEGIAGPLVKAIVRVAPGEEIETALRRAWRTAISDEPGPVLVWVMEGQVSIDTDSGWGEGDHPSPDAPNPLKHQESLDTLASRLQEARRPVLFLGVGAAGASEGVQGLAEAVRMPFFTTPSARGVIPEDHPQCLGFDPDAGGLGILNECLETSDLILALGCKLSHNGTGGFGLKLPESRLAHVNTDPRALGPNYPASLCIQGGVEAVVAHLTGSTDLSSMASDWTEEETGAWRDRIKASGAGGPLEPAVAGDPTSSVRGFLERLQRLLPRDGVVVTDSGLHQVMVRRHFKVLAPGGLLLPTDFQSMGFGLPAALGAKLASPDREVVAVIGDGGLAMSGMDLLTLAREGISVKVIVFNDGFLNLIRLHQEREFGASHGVRLENPDMDALAAACGMDYFDLNESPEEALARFLAVPGPALGELVLGDSQEIRTARRWARGKAGLRQAVGERWIRRLKRILRRD